MPHNDAEAKRAYDRARYTRNREQVLQKQKLYRQSNRERIAAMNKRYRDSIKDDPKFKAKRRAYQQQWTIDNLDHVRAIQKRSREKHQCRKLDTLLG